MTTHFGNNRVERIEFLPISSARFVYGKDEMGIESQELVSNNREVSIEEFSEYF
jgi:hypothetical protein